MTPIWWLLAFVPLLVALYFLKLRRRREVVSSTLLWRRALEDLHANAPFQRLRRSLLFLLQLLVLLALIFAAWQPRWGSGGEGGRSLILLLDVSASTKAREPGGSRFDRAREEALALIRSLEPGDHMALLAFAARTTTVAPFTSDRALLESRLRALRPTSLPTDLTQALLVAASLAETVAVPEIVVLGDGCYGDLGELPASVQGLELRFITPAIRPAAPPADNVAFTEAGVRRGAAEGGRLEVFLRVETTGRPAARTVTLSSGSRLIAAREVRLEARDAQGVIFELEDLPPGVVVARIEGEDALADDDRVFLEIPEPEKIPVLLGGSENPWIELALEAAADLEVRRAAAGAAGSGGEPVVALADREAPPAEPRVPSLYFGCHPPLPAGMAEPERIGGPAPIDWDRVHPVNRFLHYGGVRIEESLVFADGPGWHSLVDCEEGSLIGVLTVRGGATGPVECIVVGFDILGSNWPLSHVSFPLFVTNAVRWLARGSRPLGGSLRTGEPLVYRATPGRRARGGGFRLHLPDGSRRGLQVAADGTVAFTATDQVGVYALEQGGETVRRFAVSLLSAAESRLEPARTVDLGGVAIEAAAGAERPARELWPWLAWLALVAVLAEWYLYHRRVVI